MAIRSYESTLDIQKQTILSRDAESLRLKKPCKKLTFGKKSINGRNNTGTITSRHRGGAHKRLYRKIDFRRDKFNIDGRIASIEYDPNRNASICLVNYIDGEKRYILYVRGIKVGDNITSGPDASISVGNALPLTKIPLGTTIHNIELKSGKGGQLVRAAGEAAKVVAKEGRLATLRLPSSELRLVSQDCLASIGRVGNIDFNNKNLKKAGSKRWLGKRPTVRGSAMNPVDHPHGGGEGRTSIGRKRPSTPWGHAALGKKNHGKKCRNPLILRRRRST
uniref:ribosomal protein L2 n=1 Tax=Ceratopteris thalictroides TaxID=29596 RepID=UPI001FAEB0C4|nr:ribosomal protein L2 [Ceratopteris thalictroides]YP_010487982.1 ribosomal protein L2 [Ceratopteris pteridoides]UJH19148.1 ribosomal protein L2 [Ceratopteris thalictroides]UWI72084.1 ribosomal protein L2 [Ceratopteris pteridoides]